LHHRGIASAEPEIASLVFDLKARRLGDHQTETVVAIPDQFLVTKRNAGIRCGSYNAQVFKDRNDRGAKRRI